WHISLSSITCLPNFFSSTFTTPGGYLLNPPMKHINRAQNNDRVSFTQFKPFYVNFNMVGTNSKKLFPNTYASNVSTRSQLNQHIIKEESDYEIKLEDNYYLIYTPAMHIFLQGFPKYQ
ncbi:hypothetical protein KI387_004876, partial [Taxus chinensis]